MTYKSIQKRRAVHAAIKKRLRARAIEMLGGKCVLCGYVGDRLQIHHPYRRQTRPREFAKEYLTKARVERLLEERVVLVCAPCHSTLSRLLHLKRLGIISKAIELAGEP